MTLLLDLFEPEVVLGAPDPTRTVAALCVSSVSPYRRMSGVVAFDKARDARSFTGGMPVVAHPPCRAWSAYTRHQAKPEPGEADLGLMCVEWLKREGGVLEHPAHSRLFDAVNLPKPGERRGDLATIEVLQAWWGYSMRKATWLVLCGIDLRQVVFPYRPHDSRQGTGDRRRQQVMSKQQRAATHPTFAEWLVACARMSRLQEAP